MAKLKLRRPGSSLGDTPNTGSGGTTPVYPSYLQAPRTQDAASDATDDRVYKRNKSTDISPKDTIHVTKNSHAGSYKAVAKRGSEASLGEPLPASLRRGRLANITEEDDRNAVKNWVPGGKVSKAKLRK